MFGPTTGDKLRLGDTSLWIEIENDFTVYGDECKFGGGESFDSNGTDKQANRFVMVKVKHRTGATLKCSTSSSPTLSSLIGVASTR